MSRVSRFHFWKRLRERIGRFIDPGTYFAFDYSVSDLLIVAHAPKTLLTMEQSEIKQLKFLLSQSPMIDFQPDPERFTTSRTLYAYVHPITLAKASSSASCAVGHGRGYIRFPGSPTKWILTSLMPQNRVIYSPNPIPGIEKILAK